jgi:hypothetical protein
MQRLSQENGQYRRQHLGRHVGEQTGAGYEKGVFRQLEHSVVHRAANPVLLTVTHKLRPGSAAVRQSRF